MSSRRLISVVVPAAALAAVTVLAGCGNDTSENAGATTAPTTSTSTSPSSSPTSSPTTSATTSPTDSPSPTAAPAGKVKNIRVIIQDGNVYPDNKRISIDRGTTVVFHINAEVPGELHVHSSPEAHIEYGAGDTVKELTFDRPGLIAVEDHALDKLLIQLEVK